MKRDSPEDSPRFSGRDFSPPELAIIRAWLAENNWIEVGTTKGRGKLEKNHRRVLPLKSVLVYPLQQNFRAILAP